MLPVEVAFISYDPRAQMAIVFLRESGGSGDAEPLGDEAADGADDESRLLPIWIGLPEASAIYTRLEGREAARPMTHDLLVSTIDTLGASVKSIMVHALEEWVFHGRIVLDVDGRELDVDSRPSDAIALALRADAPIFVANDVMEGSAISESDIRGIDASMESLKDALESLDDDSYVKV